MYISGYFKETDINIVKNFLRQHDFATIVSHDGKIPLASHLVVNINEADENITIRGHMARSNPLWETFNQEKEILVIFGGPDAYISARWYNHVNVPTWNYISVHAYGKPILVTDYDELYDILNQLVNHYEPGTGYSMNSLPPDFVKKQIQGIVGFQLEVTRLEASFKLSQNRNDDDYASIIQELEIRKEQNSLEIAKAMREKRPI